MSTQFVFDPTQTQGKSPTHWNCRPGQIFHHSFAENQQVVDFDGSEVLDSLNYHQNCPGLPDHEKCLGSTPVCASPKMMVVRVRGCCPCITKPNLRGHPLNSERISREKTSHSTQFLEIGKKNTCMPWRRGTTQDDTRSTESMPMRIRI